MYNLLKNPLILSMVGMIAIGCSSTKPPVMPTSATTNITPANANATTGATDNSNVNPTATATANHNSVYFAFNQHDINNNYNGIIKANADYLTTDTAANIQIQGNTDDIGSEEYNLALGQQRADVVKQTLIADGVSANKIEAISNGKLKAKYLNDNDSSKAQNRRADILYQATAPSGYSLDKDGVPVVDNTFYAGNPVIEGVQ